MNNMDSMNTLSSVNEDDVINMSNKTDNNCSVMTSVNSATAMILVPSDSMVDDLSRLSKKRSSSTTPDFQKRCVPACCFCNKALMTSDLIKLHKTSNSILFDTLPIMIKSSILDKNDRWKSITSSMSSKKSGSSILFSSIPIKFYSCLPCYRNNLQIMIDACDNSYNIEKDIASLKNLPNCHFCARGLYSYTSYKLNCREKIIYIDNDECFIVKKYPKVNLSYNVCCFCYRQNKRIHTRIQLHDRNIRMPHIQYGVMQLKFKKGFMPFYQREMNYPEITFAKVSHNYISPKLSEYIQSMVNKSFNITAPTRELLDRQYKHTTALPSATDIQTVHPIVINSSNESIPKDNIPENISSKNTNPVKVILTDNDENEYFDSPVTISISLPQTKRRLAYNPPIKELGNNISSFSTSSSSSSSSSSSTSSYFSSASNSSVPIITPMDCNILPSRLNSSISAFKKVESRLNSTTPVTSTPSVMLYNNSGTILNSNEGNNFLRHANTNILLSDSQGRLVLPNFETKQIFILFTFIKYDELHIFRKHYNHSSDYNTNISPYNIKYYFKHIDKDNHNKVTCIPIPFDLNMDKILHVDPSATLICQNVSIIV